jgi:hypothetical protein
MNNMKAEIDLGILARTNKAVLSYYAMADKYKSEEAFNSWLQSLGYSNIRLRFEELGYSRSKDAIPFMRFVLELNDHGLNDYMKNNLSVEDFEQWMNPSKDLVVPIEMNVLNQSDLSKLR